MKLYKKEFNKSELGSIPENERIFFISLTALFNESNILQKCTLLSYKNFNNTNVALQKSQIALTNFFVLLQAGKLYEGWKIIHNNYLQSEVGKEYSKKFDEKTKQSIDYLKKYFGKKNIINEIRKKFTFHYDMEKINEAFELTPESEVFTLFLEETYGNTFFSLYEILTTHYIINFMKGENQVESLEMFFQEVINITRHFQKVIGNVIKLIVSKYLGDISDTIKIPSPPKIDNSTLPYFYRN